jgi:hypothetical protein
MISLQCHWIIYITCSFHWQPQGRAPGVDWPEDMLRIHAGLSKDVDAEGFRSYRRPEGKSGGHGVGWSEIPRYSFRLPDGWEETPVSIADLGGTEVASRPSRLSLQRFPLLPAGIRAHITCVARQHPQNCTPCLVAAARCACIAQRMYGHSAPQDRMLLTPSPSCVQGPSSPDRWLCADRPAVCGPQAGRCYCGGGARAALQRRRLQRQRHPGGPRLVPPRMCTHRSVSSRGIIARCLTLGKPEHSQSHAGCVSPIHVSNLYMGVSNGPQTPLFQQHDQPIST